ncbi:hypothetical protein AB0I51_02460 [Streptomyces sp. NPDC050549]|uniref:hypothetical protein n=1 Tax=Streptomyces sp. NPDC050549 TaxID=3155406 RepID=UPI003447F16D
MPFPHDPRDELSIYDVPQDRASADCRGDQRRSPLHPGPGSVPGHRCGCPERGTRNGRWRFPQRRLSDCDGPQELGGYTYVGDNPVTFSDPTGQEIGSKPNSCQYDLANCPKKVQKEVGYDPKTGRADYRRGTVVRRTSTKKTLSTTIVCGRICVVTKESTAKKKADEAARKAERKRLANAVDRTVSYLGDHLTAGVTGCMVVCVGAQVAQGGLWPSVGGLGFGGFGKLVG